MSELSDPKDEGLTKEAKCLFSLKERLELAKHQAVGGMKLRDRLLKPENKGE